MPVAKGHHDSEHNYIYQCGYCNGKGMLKGLPCPHCYNLDLPTLLKEFETARGERYYALLKAILSLKGRAILDRAEVIEMTNGKFTPIDFVRLALEFKFPMNRVKPLAEWLEECGFCPSGTYDRMQQRGFKVKDALAKIEEKE